MTPLSNEEFAERVLALAAPPDKFAPTAYYDPDGDCVEFLAKPDPFYAERVDDLLTVYYSQDTHEIVGSLIKCVSTVCGKLLKKLPGFQVEILDGRVKLAHLFLAKMWASDQSPEKIPTLTYRKLIKVAEESDAEADIHCLT